MPISIPKSQAIALGFDLAAAVAAYEAARQAHAHTIDEPAPTAHPLVEQIVREGGGYIIYDDTPTPSAGELRAKLAVSAQQALFQKIDALASPGRRQLAQLDMMEISQKPVLAEGAHAQPGVIYRSEAEQARFLEVKALFDRITTLHRHAALLQIEIDDLPDGQLAGWQPHSWP